MTCGCVAGVIVCRASDNKIKWTSNLFISRPRGRHVDTWTKAHEVARPYYGFFETPVLSIDGLEKNVSFLVELDFLHHAVTEYRETGVFSQLGRMGEAYPSQPVQSRV